MQFTGSPLDSSTRFWVMPREVFGLGGKLDPNEAHSVWGSVVNEYTKRQLSFPEDRLAAITGIISELAPVFQDECVFGIWNRNFVGQLVWFRTGQRMLANDKYDKVLACAPAWSWVSRSFEVGFMGYKPYYDPGWELQGKEAILKVKLIEGTAVPEVERYSWRFWWDIPSPQLTEYQFALEYNGMGIFYFLLGHASGMEYRKFSMVAVQGDRPGYFRRIGLVYTYSDTTAFDHVERQQIILQ